jgi:hypothetical protein
MPDQDIQEVGDRDQLLSDVADIVVQMTDCADDKAKMAAKLVLLYILNHIQYLLKQSKGESDAKTGVM